MGIVTIEKANHLFWLGRYSERMIGLIRNYMKYDDIMIDVDTMAYHDFCDRLGMDATIFKDHYDFIQRFIYDATLPFSVISTINYAFDNAVVLRDEIRGESLAYIELIKNMLSQNEHGVLMLELISILDLLNAFFGSIQDVMEEDSLALLYCGKYVEKMDIQLRFDVYFEQGADLDLVHRHLQKQIAYLENHTNFLKAQPTTLYQSYEFKDKDACFKMLGELTRAFEVR